MRPVAIFFIKPIQDMPDPEARKRKLRGARLGFRVSGLESARVCREPWARVVGFVLGFVQKSRIGGSGS